MAYHRDKEVEGALVGLMDRLCTWERETGRRSTLILIPHNPDEKIVIVQDGKPLPDNLEMSHRRIFTITIIAMEERDKN